MSENNNNTPFSPILIMEFIRQTTAGRFLTAETTDMSVKFKISNSYYTEIQNFPIQGQFINLDIEYDNATEILTVKANEALLNHFREQKSLIEIAQKYANQYKDRYQKFIEVMD